MGSQEGANNAWIQGFAGPLLSLLVFLGTYFVDPLNFGAQQPVAALPAFFLAVLVLIVEHNISTRREVRRASDFSDQIHEAVRNYLHVTSLGSPEAALRYVVDRLAILDEVKNTSFNIEGEHDRADEKFYEAPVYRELGAAIAQECAKGLLWKDVGDSLAVSRLRSTMGLVTATSPDRVNYKYRLIAHNEPQMNFCILEYKDGREEVLFNWDFRGTGQDPKVLVSRDKQILEMYSVQFTLLWRAASQDHDNVATKSVSIKYEGAGTA